MAVVLPIPLLPVGAPLLDCLAFSSTYSSVQGGAPN